MREKVDMFVVNDEVLGIMKYIVEIARLEKTKANTET